MRRLALVVAVLIALAAAAAAAAWLALPAERPRTAAAPDAEADRARVLEALRPRKRARPVVAVLAHNDGTETTDFLVPYGVLRSSDTAEVVAVALRDAPVTLMPALRIRPELDVAAFDARYPDGADYVVVPAMHRSDDPEILVWLRRQAASGATIVGVCDGTWVLGHAGLLDGHAATAHWFSARRLQKSFPRMTWRENQRYVVDDRVVTTTGVSASLPISLTLVEAIAGSERAAQLGHAFGIARWDAAHASADFALDHAALWTAAQNWLAVWARDSVAVPVAQGSDVVALALTADAYARTYRTTVRSSSSAPEVVTEQGLTIVADDVGAESAPRDAIALPAAGASALDVALEGIARRYGDATADFVALQLEYERPPRGDGERRPPVN